MSPTPTSWKDKISSPLEAGASLAQGHQLPAHLIPALEYASKKLAKKDLSVTLLVIRKEYQIPSCTSPAEHRCPLLFSPSVLNPPSSAPPYLTFASYSPSSTNLPGKHAFATATLATIKHFVRSSNLGAPANADRRERKTRNQPPQPVHVPAQIHNRSRSAATVLTSLVPGPVPGHENTSPSEAGAPSGTYSNASSNGSGDIKQKAARWLGGSLALGSSSNPTMSPALDPRSMTPVSLDSPTPTPTPTAAMAMRDRTPASAMSEATSKMPSPGRRFTIKLLYSAPLSSKDKKTLLSVIEKTRRKFKIEPNWLPAPISPFAIGLTADLVQRSLRQNEALFSSPYYTSPASATPDPSVCRNSLRLLSLDHLYDLCCALARYTCTRAGPHLEDAVDELHRLVLSRGRRRLLKSVLLASYHNTDFIGVHGHSPDDKMSPSLTGNAPSHLRTVSEAALNDLSRMYALAYGKEGLVDDVSTAVPNWPLPNGRGEVDVAVGEMMMTATMNTADITTLTRSGSIAWGRPALGSVARAREELARRKLERQLEEEQEELRQRARQEPSQEQLPQQPAQQRRPQLQQEEEQQQRYSHTPKSSYSSTMTAATTATMASIGTAATSIPSSPSPPRLSISKSPRFSSSSTTWLFPDFSDKARTQTLAPVTEPGEEEEEEPWERPEERPEEQREESQEPYEENPSPQAAKTLEALEPPSADGWYRDLRLVASNDYATKAARSIASPTPWKISGGARALSPVRSVETLLAGGNVPGSGGLNLVLSTASSQAAPKAAYRALKATNTTFTTTISTHADGKRRASHASTSEPLLLVPSTPEEDMEERISIGTDTTSQVIESFPSPPARSTPKLLRTKASSLSSSSASSSQKGAGGSGSGAAVAVALKTVASLGGSEGGAGLRAASVAGGKSLALKLQTSFDGGDDPNHRHDGAWNSALFRPRLRSPVGRPVVVVDASDDDSGLLDLHQPQQAQKMVATPPVPSHETPGEATEYSLGGEENEGENEDENNDELATMVSMSDYDREDMNARSEIYSADFDDDDFDFGNSNADGESPASIRRMWAAASRTRRSCGWSGQQQEQQDLPGQSGIGLGLWTGTSLNNTHDTNNATAAAAAADAARGGPPVSRRVNASSIAEMAAQLRAAARTGEFAGDTPSAHSPADGESAGALERAIATSGSKPEPAAAAAVGNVTGTSSGIGIEDVCNDVGLTPVATSFTGTFGASSGVAGAGLGGGRVGPATPNAAADVSPATRNEWEFLMRGKPGGRCGRTAPVEEAGG